MNTGSSNAAGTLRRDDSPSILVVDDYPPNLVALEVALESLGEPLQAVSSGRVALEQMSANEFAVALIDVQMPHLSGIELAQQLRRLGNETPIIFLTANDGDDRLREKGYQLGAVDFLVKPVEADVLQAKVSTFIKLHHQKRELARLTSSYDAERRVARQQLKTLAAVSENLATCVTSEEVVQAFLTEAHLAVAANNSFIYVRPHDDALEMELAGVRGIPPEALARFQRVSLDQDLPVTAVVKTGDRVWCSDRRSLARAFSALDERGRAEALAALPVIVNGRAVGAVAFSFLEKRQWDDDEREFFVTLVALLTTALERARLLAEERKTNDELARRGEALRLMADVGTLLSSSLDYESVLSQLTHIVVPTIADWCAVDVLDQEGRIQRLSAYHSDPAKIALAHAIEERYPGDPNAPHGVPNVLRTGQSEWIEEIPDELLVAVTRNEEHLELARSLGLRSYIAVPLAARGKILGALSLVYAESARRYTLDDVRYAEQLAQRAALAIDNAKLFRDQVKAREALERRARQALLVADIGTALARGGGSLAEALQRCADAIVRHSDAALARIWTLDPRGDTLELEASAGLFSLTDGPHAHVPMGQFSVGRIAKERKPYFTNDLNQERWQSDPLWLSAEGMTAFAGYPLIVGEKLKGVVAVLSPRALAEDAVAGLSSIADAIALGIDRTRADHRARVERDTLEVVNEVGRSLAAELDQERLVQAVTDYSTRLAGAAFGAFFYNVTSPTGESYMLYAISGVAREEFSKFPMPRNTQVFAPTFNGQGTLRVDDIRKDPRYGHTAPYYGMPEGHLPVRSYLAVPVVSRNGTVIGGLFFGHPEPAMFTERHEDLVGGVAAQAAIAMDNARLFAEAQRLIAELDESNKDLDQFAYIASHDLKAPLRGISNLSQWLEEDLEEAITPAAKEHLTLLRNRVSRMEGLINGILEYSRAGRLRTKPEPVAVGKLLSEIIEMISVPEGARIEVQAGLPVLRTERVPLQQVFMNLLNNAIKHAKRSDPHVTVTARDEGDYVEFAVADNGPGIAPEFHERIWGIFQTLEPRDVVEGTGIGLSVVKKIVGHKGGRVEIESREGAGAKFVFTWPKSEKASNV